MTSKLTFGLLCTGVLFGLLATTMDSQALTCTRGGYTTKACFNALDRQIGEADDIKTCLRAMDDEYSGKTDGVRGAGKNFNAIKANCLKIAQDLLNGVSADSATSDSDSEPKPDVEAVKNALTAWARRR